MNKQNEISLNNKTEEALSCLESLTIIVNIINRHANKTKIRIKNKHLPWYDKEVRLAVNHRNEQHAYAYTVSTDKSHVVWGDWRIIRNNVKSLIRNKMITFFETKTNEFKNIPAKYWKLYNSVVKMRKSKNKTTISPFSPNLNSSFLDIFSQFIIGHLQFIK